MANRMMASHGRGQQVDRLKATVLGGVALVALGFGGVPGTAMACHIRHKAKPAGSASTPTGTTPTVASAQILTPTSLVPQVPPLTPTTAPLPTVIPTSVVPPTPSPADALTPTPLTNPPAAEQITPTSAPPAVAVWHDPVPTASAPCGCPPPPVCSPPIPSAPPAGEEVNPPSPTLPPSASDTVTTPEPSTIVSALVMMGVAIVYRRRSRTEV